VYNYVNNYQICV